MRDEGIELYLFIKKRMFPPLPTSSLILLFLIHDPSFLLILLASFRPSPSSLFFIHPVAFW